MSQISSPVSSIAQTAITQKDQAERQDKTRQSTSLATQKQRLLSDNKEFVETMAEASGLKINPDSSHEGENRRKKRLSDLAHKPAAEEDQVDIQVEENRARRRPAVRFQAERW